MGSGAAGVASNLGRGSAVVASSLGSRSIGHTEQMQMQAFSTPMPSQAHFSPQPTLHSLPCHQDLVDLAKPGDRITVTGVYKATGVRTNPRLRELKVRCRGGRSGPPGTCA